MHILYNNFSRSIHLFPRTDFHFIHYSIKDSSTLHFHPTETIKLSYRRYCVNVRRRNWHRTKWKWWYNNNNNSIQVNAPHRHYRHMPEPTYQTNITDSINNFVEEVMATIWLTRTLGAFIERTSTQFFFRWTRSKTIIRQTWWCSEESIAVRKSHKIVVFVWYWVRYYHISTIL